MTRPAIEVSDIIIDCEDPEGLARFWSGVLDRRAGSRSGPYVVLERGSEHDIGIGSQHVDGLRPKSSKNRVHLDVSTTDIPSPAERVVELGGRRLPGYEDGGFLVMADLEGNEFCIVSVAPVDADDHGRTRYLEGLKLPDIT